MEKLFFNRKELVAAVGLSFSSIYRLERAGKFPARRIVGDRAVRWLVEEVMEWARNTEVVRFEEDDK